MKKAVTMILTAGFLLGVVFGAYAIHEVIPSETQVPLPRPSAEDLNAYIVRYKPYLAWETWPGKEKLYKGTEPHGALLKTFVNDTAYQSIKRKIGMTDGSIIVTENYSSDKKFLGLTVMYKVKHYNPEAGDWFWVKYRSDGRVDVSGRVRECIDCHGTMKGSDYVLIGE